MIDTISNILGVIDGNSPLKDCSFEPKLLLDTIDTEGEPQDSFLEFIEEFLATFEVLEASSNKLLRHWPMKRQLTS